jgi:hypothetical protein
MNKTRIGWTCGHGGPQETTISFHNVIFKIAKFYAFALTNSLSLCAQEFATRKGRQRKVWLRTTKNSARRSDWQRSPDRRASLATTAVFDRQGSRPATSQRLLS